MSENSCPNINLSQPTDMTDINLLIILTRQTFRGCGKNDNSFVYGIR